jgi:hypothetical protein
LNRVDGNILRVIAFEVSFLTLLLLLTQESMFAFILLSDFLLRTFRFVSFSPLYLIAKFIIKGWGIEPKLCDESPKRFALYLGLVVSLFLVLFYLSGSFFIATMIALILLSCALLETFFEYCIGCQVYYVLQMGKRFF